MLDRLSGAITTEDGRPVAAFAEPPRIMDLGLITRALKEKQVDLIAGNDGGNYKQHSDSGRFDKASWGEGNQTGFHTLLPYGVAMAKDRTVWAGLQDNGQMRIDPKTGV